MVQRRIRAGVSHGGGCPERACTRDVGWGDRSGAARGTPLPHSALTCDGGLTCAPGSKPGALLCADLEPARLARPYLNVGGRRRTAASRGGPVAKFWRLRLVEPAGGIGASEPEVAR